MGTAFTLFRAITYAVLFMGTLLVFLPARLLEWSGFARPERLGATEVAGAVLVVLGGALAIACIATFVQVGRGTPAPFDPPRRLVRSGPYRFVRNPMYWGAMLVLCGAALFYRSLALLGYALVFFGVVDLFVRFYEEPTLRRLFGAEYESYCRETGRWLPTRPRAE